MERELTCIICPRGCRMKVALEGKEVVSVEGNACPRGKTYAVTECTNPHRTVTSTVRCEDGSVLPVKTETTIAKADMEKCMREINAAVAKLPVSIGDVILSDVCGTRVIATANKNA
ncbi:MAG: DUF1667 domain-containing protein [Clostridia bacterium]|nr:DUF1667 domain-containing protein [Clostridia bacterium]